jgi:DNA polymerase
MGGEDGADSAKLDRRQYRGLGSAARRGGRLHARQMLGKVVTISGTRGKAIALAEGGLGWVTIHPSFLLRMPDKSRAEDEFAAFVEDLKGAAKAVG